MSYGRDTSTLRITRQNKEDLIACCSHPALMREVIQRVERLAFIPAGPERDAHLVEYHTFCKGLPCILWQPEDSSRCNMQIRVTREPDTALIKLCRVVWTVCHVVSEQGPALRGHEEVLHSCGRNGASDTSYGACINPDHLVRGTEETRQQLKEARVAMRKVGVRSMGVQA